MGQQDKKDFGFFPSICFVSFILIEDSAQNPVIKINVSDCLQRKWYLKDQVWSILI